MKVKALGHLQSSSCYFGGPLTHEIKVQADVPSSDAYPGAPLLSCPALFQHAGTPCQFYHLVASSFQ